jgi:hypothetical protein
MSAFGEHRTNVSKKVSPILNMYYHFIYLFLKNTIIENPLDFQFPTCDAQNFLNTDYQEKEFTAQKPENFIMCIAYENLPYMGKFYNPLNASVTMIADTLNSLKSSGYSNNKL